MNKKRLELNKQQQTTNFNIKHSIVQAQENQMLFQYSMLILHVLHHHL